MEKGWVAAFGIGLALLVPGGAEAQARFVTVDQGPDELAADVVLAGHLGRSLVASPKTEGYKAVIDDLVADNASEGTVARVTPYAFVVAEMLGARLDLLATCRSRAGGSTTYGAYLVVRRSNVPAPPGAATPTPTQVKEFLQARSAAGEPARFVYHDRFSTSSYFLPSIYFRRQRVFAGRPDPSERDISAIRVERLEDRSSSDLVVAVAEGGADVASVWDGTRAKFQRDPRLASLASRVWFIRLPNNLPDDLLVATRRARSVVEAIRGRLAAPVAEPYPETSDVNGWVLWTDNAAEEARTALSELRRQAAASAQPVVVDVRAGGDAPAKDDEVEAARQALRLAGTELVAKCESSDFRNVDVVWQLARIHDGAVRLLVRYDHFRYSPTGQDVTQQFDISFKDPADLTRRVSLLVTTRMHRIRPLWLYWDAAPTVIRDVAFDASPELPVQEILWKNPRRNDYQVLEHKVARLESSDFNKLVLAKGELGDLGFEPMGRRAVRVLLVRPNRERPLFTALTVVFVALLVLAAAGLAWDARPGGRRPAPASPKAPSPDRAVPVPALAPAAEGHAPALTGPGSVTRAEGEAVADIFLSYKSEDQERARRIERALTARGWDVFWDEELRLGDRFRQALAAELTSARCVVVLWSTLSVQSEWVLDEASRANKRGKLIAVQIDDVELPLGFGEMQVGNLIGWDGDPEALGFRELVQGVSDKLARAIKPAASVVVSPMPAPVRVAGPPSVPELAPAPGLVQAECRLPVQPLSRLGTTVSSSRSRWLRPTLLLAFVLLANLVETSLDKRLTPSSLGAQAGYPITEAFRGLEEKVGLSSFASHDATNALATYGYTFAYFFLLPLLCLHVALSLARREDPRPYRALSLAVAIDYAVSLPFFLFFPVPERWAVFESEAMLLSDKWSDRLIEAIRPISGLDNSFPSNHVSLVVLALTASVLFAVPLRRCAIPLGATVVLSTFVLGVHWLPDMLAGLGLGVSSLLLAWRLTRAGRLAFLWGDDRPSSQDAPTATFAPAVQQAA